MREGARSLWRAIRGGTDRSGERLRIVSAADVRATGAADALGVDQDPPPHRQGGKVAGRLEAACDAIDRTHQGTGCSIVVILASGRLALQGASLDKPIPGMGGGAEEYIVTGGTHDFEHATGVMTRKGNGEHDTLTFTLHG